MDEEKLACREVITQHEIWTESRKKTIEEFTKLAKYLHRLELAVNITNISTSVASVPLTATCIAAGFATMGLSVIIGLGVAGAVIGMGAAATNLAQTGIKEKKRKVINATLITDKEHTDKLIASIVKLENLSRNPVSLKRRKIAQALNDWKSVPAMGANIAKTCFKGVRIAKLVEEGAETALTTTAKVGKTVGAVLGGIGIAIDVFVIAKSSHSIAKGSKCSLGNEVEAATDALKEELAKIQSLIYTIKRNM